MQAIDIFQVIECYSSCSSRFVFACIENWDHWVWVQKVLFV